MGIYREAHKYRLQRFLTLTLPANYDGDFIQSLRYINEVFRKFRVYLERRYGQSSQFIRIPEPQKRGVAHLHVLVDRYIPQAWISEVWSRLGGGKICDIRFVDIHRISGYISKYMTKEMLSAQYPTYRRYGTSRGIHIIEKRESVGKWTLVCGSIDTFWAGVGTMLGAGLVKHVKSYNEVDGLLDSFEWVMGDFLRPPP